MDLVANEPVIRLTAFLGVMALIYVIQRRWPARGDGQLSSRQAVNLSNEYNDVREQGLLALLLNPFRNPVPRQPKNTP